MSSRNIQSAAQGVILIANDLLTGRSVYRTAENSWSTNVHSALVLSNEDQAQPYLQDALQETTAVIDPYLIATDKNGRPEHIREAIRVRGPSIQYAAKL